MTGNVTYVVLEVMNNGIKFNFIFTTAYFPGPFLFSSAEGPKKTKWLGHENFELMYPSV